MSSGFASATGTSCGIYGRKDEVFGSYGNYLLLLSPSHALPTTQQQQHVTSLWSDVVRSSR